MEQIQRCNRSIRSDIFVGLILTIFVRLAAIINYVLQFLGQFTISAGETLQVDEDGAGIVKRNEWSSDAAQNTDRPVQSVRQDLDM